MPCGALPRARARAVSAVASLRSGGAAQEQEVLQPEPSKPAEPIAAAAPVSAPASLQPAAPRAAVVHNYHVQPAGIAPGQHPMAPHLVGMVPSPYPFPVPCVPGAVPCITFPMPATMGVQAPFSVVHIGLPPGLPPRPHLQPRMPPQAMLENAACQSQQLNKQEPETTPESMEREQAHAKASRGRLMARGCASCLAEVSRCRSVPCRFGHHRRWERLAPPPALSRRLRWAFQRRPLEKLAM